MVMTMKIAAFFDVMSCGSSKHRSFGEMYRLHHQCDKNLRARNYVSSNKELHVTSVASYC
jgi:hypothetical protein